MRSLPCVGRAGLVGDACFEISLWTVRGIPNSYADRTPPKVNLGGLGHVGSENGLEIPLNPSLRRRKLGNADPRG